MKETEKEDDKEKLRSRIKQGRKGHRINDLKKEERMRESLDENKEEKVRKKKYTEKEEKVKEI